MAAARLVTPSFTKMFSRCRPTVCWLITSSVGDLAVGLPGGNVGQNFALPRRQRRRVRAHLPLNTS